MFASIFKGSVRRFVGNASIMRKAIKRKVDFYDISGKDVYVFEDRASALLPWAQVRTRLSEPPHLITLDRHTDAFEAFRRLLSRTRAGRRMGGSRSQGESKHGEDVEQHRLCERDHS